MCRVRVLCGVCAGAVERAHTGHLQGRTVLRLQAPCSVPCHCVLAAHGRGGGNSQGLSSLSGSLLFALQTPGDGASLPGNCLPGLKSSLVDPAGSVTPGLRTVSHRGRTAQRLWLPCIRTSGDTTQL